MQKSLESLACRDNVDSGTDENQSPLAFKKTGQQSGSSQDDKILSAIIGPVAQNHIVGGTVHRRKRKLHQKIRFNG